MTCTCTYSTCNYNTCNYSTCTYSYNKCSYLITHMACALIIEFIVQTKLILHVNVHVLYYLMTKF